MQIIYSQKKMNINIFKNKFYVNPPTTFYHPQFITKTFFATLSTAEKIFSKDVNICY